MVVLLFRGIGVPLAGGMFGFVVDTFIALEIVVLASYTITLSSVVIFDAFACIIIGAAPVTGADVLADVNANLWVATMANS